ncbi:hypothetical protein BBO_00200 [Beauveria brongniartii RCEF 3172]|uniref:Uncharacterized protein n=1 Tax=Beauveria brongniartii RCEF 3172 TaxID=1081107 RepID=A0A167KY23_9HYPO|nr:hypothetical protein BBO_00200 [Beauveria brongniartii RCEF 3172]
MAEDNPSFSTDSHLQIGIEIEFVAPRNTAWEDEHLPFVEHWNHSNLSKDACFHRLAEALQVAGLPSCYQMKTTPLRCPGNPLLTAAPRGAVVLQSCRLLGDPLWFRVRDGRAGLFRYWLVKGEHNLTDVSAYKTWIECELNTPILAEADVAVGPLPQLGTALTALHAAAANAPPHPMLEHHRADLHMVAPVLCKHKHAAPGSADEPLGGATATTVEFRCAQASFSARFVRAWARLVLAVGRVALLPTDEYRAALGRMWAAAQVSGGTVAEREEATMATLGELSVAAVEAGMLGGGLDLAYWRVRYGLMRAGRNPDIDEEGRAVLDQV